MGLAEGFNALVIGLKDMIDIILILGILILLVVILKIIEKGYRIKLELRRKDRNLFYSREIKKLMNLKDPPERILDKMNIISRSFFSEAFNFSYHLEYLELAEEFKKKGIKEGVGFCRLISELNYSGEEISKSKVKAAAVLLREIVKNNRILSEEEKLLVEKKKKLASLNAKKTSEWKEKEAKENPEESKEKILSKSLVPKKDINHINWRYKFKIMMLRLKGKIPELRNVDLKREHLVSGVN